MGGARVLSVTIAIAAHAAAGLALWIASAWKIERLPWPVEGPVTVALPDEPEEHAAPPRASKPGRLEPAPRPRSRRAASRASQPGSGARALSDGRTAAALGLARGGTGGTPAPRRVATPPRPVSRYEHLIVRSSSKRAVDGVIRVTLEVDARGRVVRVILVRGLGGEIDRTAIDLARRFRFFPARDQAGVPIATRVSWTFHVESPR